MTSPRDIPPPITADEDDRLDTDLVPTLDGVRLQTHEGQAGEQSFTTEDGQPVSKDRERDIVYVNPLTEGAGWWQAAELASAGDLLFDDHGLSDDEGPPPEEAFAGAPRPVSVGEETFSEGDVVAMLGSVGEAFVPAARPEFSAASFHRFVEGWATSEEPPPPPAPSPAPGRGGGSSPDDDAPELPWGLWKADLSVEEDAEAPEGATAWRAEVFWGEDATPCSYLYWIERDDDGQVRRAGWREPPPPLGGAGFVPPAEATLTDLFATLDDE